TLTQGGLGLPLGGSTTVTVAPITITGPSAGVTISGRFFSVNGNTTATLFGLTIMHSSFFGLGGGIYNLGTLTVSASTFTGNSAVTGGSGGIYNNVGTTTLTSDIVVGNSGGDFGGVNGASPASSFNLIGSGGGLVDGQNGNQVGVSLANAGLAP